jgi:putative ABC transport system substrate-binding protein
MGLSKGGDSRRRALLAALAALFPCRAAFGRSVHVVGFLGGADEAQAVAGPLAELGYVQGQNLRLEVRAAASIRHMPGAATALVALQPNALVGRGPAAVMLAGATPRIPVVCWDVPDPVGSGLAESLGRPGRNVTGLTTGSAETAAIAFGLLERMRPGLRRIAVLHSPRMPVEVRMRPHGEAAKAAGLEWILAPVTGADDVERTLSALAGQAAWMGPIAVRGLPDEVLAIAKRHRVATIGPHRGALMWYEREFTDAPRRVAAILDLVLKGASPAGIAFEQPDRQTFILDRSMARAIGIEIPQDVLLRATQVVE